MEQSAAKSVDDIFLAPGELVVRSGGRIKTLLGSCVAVCLYDRFRHTGGMCHFILPDASHATPGAMPDFSFGDKAIRELLRQFKNNGSRPEHLDAKLLGGGHVIGNIDAEIGKRNGLLAQALLAQYRIKVTGESLGGHLGRRVLMDTSTGEVWTRFIDEQTQMKSLILIGASTGGTQALATILQKLSSPMPPILITQHMPAAFVDPFAQSLQRLTNLIVKTAVDNERIVENHVYLAPGGKHLKIQERAGEIFASHSDEPPRHSCKPAVDVMFESARDLRSRHLVAVVLTGMGSDGALGLSLLRKAGAQTMTQDEQSCIVFGMPKAVIDLGAAQEILPLSEIAQALVEKCS